MRIMRLAVVASLLPASALEAQGLSPIVLLWPGGTRNSAMANASVTPRDDEALFYNPAEIGVNRPITDNRMPVTPVHSAGISWQRIGNATLHTAGAVFQAGRAGVGIGARRLTFESSGLPITASSIGDDGSQSGSSVAIVAGVSRRIRGVSVGVAANYGEDRVGAEAARRTTFDVGFAKAISFFASPFLIRPNPFHLGLSIQNLGASTVVNGVRTRAPTMITAGAGVETYPRRTFDISGNASVSVRRDGRVIPRTGWELAWTRLDRHTIAARAGLRWPEFEGQSPVTFGLGLIRDDVYLDYAFEPAFDMHTSHRIGLRVR